MFVCIVLVFVLYADTTNYLIWISPSMLKIETTAEIKTNAICAFGKPAKFVKTYRDSKLLTWKGQSSLKPKSERSVRPSATSKVANNDKAHNLWALTGAGVSNPWSPVPGAPTRPDKSEWWVAGQPDGWMPVSSLLLLFLTHQRNQKQQPSPKQMIKRSVEVAPPDRPIPY